EAQFLLAEEAPRGKRGEIQKSEVDRLLDLVCVGPREEHVGDMRLDRGDALPVIDARRIRECGEKPRLQLLVAVRVGRHGVASNQACPGYAPIVDPAQPDRLIVVKIAPTSPLCSQWTNARHGVLSTH